MKASPPSIAQAKLAEAKQHCELLAMDFDGTLADGNQYQKEDALGLITEILACQKTPAIITARAATAVKTFVPPLQAYYRKHPDALATYIAGGNGTVLYCLNTKGIEALYNQGLTLAQVKTIVAQWQSYADVELPLAGLSEKGLQTFKQFYTEDWQYLIPAAVLDLGRSFAGRIFTEEAKVTFVFPKDVSRHQSIVAAVQTLIGNDFCVAAGDKDFCHITKRLQADSKQVAVKAILQRLGLNETQVASFGDMPHGNDRGLLSFPYSFTNCDEFASKKNDFQVPPYVLPDPDLAPVARVYKAIRYMLQS